MQELGVSPPTERTHGSLTPQRRPRDTEPEHRQANATRDRGQAWRAWAIVILAGYVLVAATLYGFGMLLTHVLVRHGASAVDMRITNWFVARRSETWNTITRWATLLANTEPVVGIAAVVTGALLIARRWREALFL